jgi:type II secretory pathway pseudopilin PulG
MRKGQSLVELIIVIGLCGILLPGLLTGLITARSGGAQQSQKDQATVYLKETEEIVQHIKNTDWAKLIPLDNSPLHPTRSGNDWILSSPAEIVDGFTKQIQLTPVYRDIGGTIIISTDPNFLDPSTVRVLTTISWTAPISTSLTSTTYLTHYSGNITKSDTTDVQFNNGTKSKVSVTKTDDGEVVLDTGGNGDWCQPTKLPVPELDLPKNGVANAITAIVGRIFAGTGDNSSGISFANVNLDNSSPPVATVIGTFDGYKTNGIFGETNYAYLATDKKIVIIDLTKVVSGNYLESGSFDLGNKKFSTVYVSGNIGFATVDSTLYTFDLTGKTGSRPQLGSIGLGANAVKITVVGNLIYVAVDSSNNQLRIYQYSPDGKTLSFQGQLTVSGGSGRDIYVNSAGTRAYLATVASTSQNELFVINVQNPSSPSLIKSFDTNGMDPRGVTAVANDTITIVVGWGGIEYQVVRIPADSSPMNLCGSWNIDTGVNGIASVFEPDGDVFSYIITGDTSRELKLITGGGGSGGIYTSNGTFTSQAFDLGHSVVFNRFFYNASLPANTSIQFQIAAADPGPSGCSDAAYTFIGPDLTEATKYTDGSPIPFNNDGIGFENPARCFKYRAFLSTADTNVTPVLKDFNFNYTP